MMKSLIEFSVAVNDICPHAYVSLFQKKFIPVILFLSGRKVKNLGVNLFIFKKK
jgi:hypothetical protein